MYQNGSFWTSEFPEIDFTENLGGISKISTLCASLWTKKKLHLI